MVTTATPGTEAEATPTPESPTPQTDGGQELLIPPEPEVEETPKVEGQGEQAEGAAETAVDGAAKTETKTEKTDTEETVEPAATLTRAEHETAVAEAESKVRSGQDKRFDALEKQTKEALTAAETRAVRAEQQTQAQQLEIQVSQKQRQLATEYASQGLPEEEALRLAAVKTEGMKISYEHEMARRATEAENVQLRAGSEQTNARVVADRLAKEHGVSENDIPLLMTARTPDDMTALAKRFGEANTESKELAAKTEAEVPAGGDANKIDSGGGAAGGMTDDQFIAVYASGDSDDHKRYGQIRTARGF